MIKKGIVSILIIVISLVLSLFILPSEIHLIRFIEVSAPPDKVWSAVSTIESWESWWAPKGGHGSIDWLDGSTLKITETDEKRRKVLYELSEHEGKGNLTIDLSPESMDKISDNDKVNIRWEHKYNVGYNPFDRLNHWLSRGKMSLDIDKGLNRLKTNLEQKQTGSRDK